MTEKLYEARVSTFRKEGTRCHLSMQTCEVYAEDEDELRATIAEEFEGEEVTIDQIKLIDA
jgi:hypothetical protein